MIETIIDAVNQCPEYIGKGIMQLLVLTVGGFLVAWVATRFFGRKSEINAVEGALLKRKFDIYEELYGKLEALKTKAVVPSQIKEAAVEAIKSERIVYNPLNENQLFCIFNSPQSLTDEYLSLENYLVTKRLYYDNDVMTQTLRFQSYFGILRRLLEMFEEQFVDLGIPLDKQQVAEAERLLTVEIGIILQDEFVDQIDKLGAAMKKSFQNLSFEHRDQIGYDYDYYNSPEGPVMKELGTTRLFTQRDQMTLVVTKAVAMGMVGIIMPNKTK